MQVDDKDVELKLPNGFVIRMSLKITGGAVVASPMPTWGAAGQSHAYMGIDGYTGIQGSPAIYKAYNNHLPNTVTMSDVRVSRADGSAPVSGLEYSLVIADAETTDSHEHLTWKTTGNNSSLRLLNDPSKACNASQPLSSGSTEWTCNHSGGTQGSNPAPTPILASDNPSSMSVQWSFNRGRQGRQGVALGVLMSNVQETGTSGPNQKRYRAKADDKLAVNITYKKDESLLNETNVMDGGTVIQSGTVTANYQLLNAQDAKVFMVTDNATVSPGSLFDPSMYTTTVVCTNGVDTCAGTVHTQDNETVNKVRYFNAKNEPVDTDAQGQPVDGGQNVAYAFVAPNIGDNIHVTFTRTPIVAKISFTKQVEADDPANAENSKKRTFTFTGELKTDASIYNQNGATQQPGGIDDPSATITGTGSQNMELPKHDNADLTDTFALQKGGEYTFTVQEQVPTDKDKDQYIKYDDQPRTVTVTVADNGTVTTTNGTGGNTFVNRILAKPTLTFKKTVDNTWAGGNDNTPYAQQPSAWQLKANDTVYSFTGAPTAANQQNQWVQQSEKKAQLEPGSYTLSEAKAVNASAYVNGYSAGGWSCTDGTATVAVTNNAVTLKPGQNVVCSITNTAQPATLTWSKVNLAGDTIGGSEWSLTGTSHPNGLTVVDDGSNDGATNPGELEVSNLKWGEYTLTETKAPEGYITPTGTSAQTKVMVAPTTSTQNSAFTVSAGEIVNHKKVSQLPFTGEQGATPLAWLAVAGGLGALAVLSAVGISVWRRRRML